MVHGGRQLAGLTGSDRARLFLTEVRLTTRRFVGRYDGAVMAASPLSTMKRARSNTSSKVRISTPS